MQVFSLEIKVLKWCLLSLFNLQIFSLLGEFSKSDTSIEASRKGSSINRKQFCWNKYLFRSEKLSGAEYQPLVQIFKIISSPPPPLSLSLPLSPSLFFFFFFFFLLLKMNSWILDYIAWQRACMFTSECWSSSPRLQSAACWIQIWGTCETLIPKEYHVKIKKERLKDFGSK